MVLFKSISKQVPHSALDVLSFKPHKLSLPPPLVAFICFRNQACLHLPCRIFHPLDLTVNLHGSVVGRVILEPEAKGENSNTGPVFILCFVDFLHWFWLLKYCISIFFIWLLRIWWLSSILCLRQTPYSLHSGSTPACQRCLKGNLSYISFLGSQPFLTPWVKV